MGDFPADITACQWEEYQRWVEGYNGNCSLREYLDFAWERWEAYEKAMRGES